MEEDEDAGLFCSADWRGLAPMVQWPKRGWATKPLGDGCDVAAKTITGSRARVASDRLSGCLSRFLTFCTFLCRALLEDALQGADSECRYLYQYVSAWLRELALIVLQNCRRRSLRSALSRGFG